MNIPADGDTKDIKIYHLTVLFKYLSSFWKNLEMSSINWEIFFILIWLSTRFITNLTNAEAFPETDTNFYISVRTLHPQDNAKLLRK